VKKEILKAIFTSPNRFVYILIADLHLAFKLRSGYKEVDWCGFLGGKPWKKKIVEKSNEITAIPTLLEEVALEGCIVTIDVMECRYKIADQVIKKE
jgi:hypothetical protein